jgi:hypothetical protein
MELSVWFWAIFVLSLLFRGVRAFSADAQRAPGWIGDLILAVLIAILGYAVFGDVVK